MYEDRYICKTLACEVKTALGASKAGRRKTPHKWAPYNVVDALYANDIKYIYPYYVLIREAKDSVWELYHSVEK